METLPMKKYVSHAFFWALIYGLCALIFGMFRGLSLGMMLILPLAVGLPILWLASRGKFRLKIFGQVEKGGSEHKKMTFKAFMALFCLMCLVQILSTVLGLLIDRTGAQGTSIPIDLSSFLLILYAGFLGPIAEELAYRGFLRGNLRGLGKLPAIVVSALAFGLMHGNLKQSLFATLFGILLGYFATEYSLWWTIIVHILNNFVLGTLPGLFTGKAAEIANRAVSGIVFASAVAALFILSQKKAEIKDWIRDEANRAVPGAWKEVLKSFWFWVYVIVYVSIIILLMVVPGWAAALQ